ncbi:MAG: 4-alpha-glucanotransferase [Lachnospiraceae bacterium]|nr:4-alpha-glucanotransferase [Lachnospiraceae bacterium]
MRDSGILLPISSIPSKYGIGGFSKEAYEFVDFVKESGCKYWQILPLCPTGYGDSPYQGFSTFAGNPYFIDLEALIKEGLLTEDECDVKMELEDGTKIAGYGTDPEYVDYERIYMTRWDILRKAYKRSNFRNTEEYRKFHEENREWLDDYALYMAVKENQGGSCWINWEEGIRLRTNEALDKAWRELIDEIDFYRFQQFIFMKQWTKLKAYANERGIKIIGDVPIYVALDCSDVWANQKMFMFDKDGKPTDVAGCPPDAFSATGQLWGNPLYDWNYHKSTDFEWWIRRMRHCYKLYDVVRVDHFRGFDAFYAIPADADTAINGRWLMGPGISLFRKIKAELGDVPIIAEDLGFLTPSVIDLLKDTGFPGMKVMQFAFDPYHPNEYLPHNHSENCVVYTGTHDNDTTKGWYTSLRDDEKAFVLEYMAGDFKTPGDNDTDKKADKQQTEAQKIEAEQTGTHQDSAQQSTQPCPACCDQAVPVENASGCADAAEDAPAVDVITENIAWNMIKLTFSSVAKLAVIPMQDFLNLGSEARINMPSSLGTNWKWRMKAGAATHELAQRIARLNFIYGRTADHSIL